MNWLYKAISLILLSFILLSAKSYAQDEESNKKIDIEFSGNYRTDYKLFFNESLYPGQHSSYFSMYIQPKLSLNWETKKNIQNIQIEGFGRLDQFDNVSSHLDFRELYWQLIQKNWELTVGAKQMYWGVTESNHLVDVINQLDALEGFDIQQKLGQPMIHVSNYSKLGTIDVIGMAFFRPMIFPGLEGRPRPPGMVDYKNPKYQSKYGRYQPEIAIRWSNSFNVFDVGLSNFYGTARAPIFKSDNGQDFYAFYEVINQTGLDIQAATGSILWKAEMIYRVSKRKTINAFVVGGEYTFSNIFKTGADLGFVAEYNYDNRGEELLTALNNDVFIGFRITGNDIKNTEALVGYTVDLNNNTQQFILKIDRRLSDNWKVNIEAWGFPKVASSEFVYFFRNDTYIKGSLILFF